MKAYNKLVRDKIPDIILLNNEIPTTKILSDEDYLKELNIKIQEEMNEYLESGNIEELADLEEVLRAILDAKHVSYEKFEEIRSSKVEKRGAFKDKIYLINVED